MIVNLTPHDISVLDEDNALIWRYEKSDSPARCSVNRHRVGEIGLIPLYESEFGKVENLPEPQKGTWFIVSRIVAEAMKGIRNDLIIPDDTVRDDEGRIIGCKGFARI